MRESTWHEEARATGGNSWVPEPEAGSQGFLSDKLKLISFLSSNAIYFMVVLRTENYMSPAPSHSYLGFLGLEIMRIVTVVA